MLRLALEDATRLPAKMRGEVLRASSLVWPPTFRSAGLLRRLRCLKRSAGELRLLPEPRVPPLRLAYNDGKHGSHGAPPRCRFERIRHCDARAAAPGRMDGSRYVST